MWRHLLEIYEESRLNAGQPECFFAETLIFNEGWLLRSALKEWKGNSTSSRLPFLPFPANAVVYSEGQLRTPFKARIQGDPRAESHTRVDGIAGHFSIADGTKSGIELAPDCPPLPVPCRGSSLVGLSCGPAQGGLARYVAVFEAKAAFGVPSARGLRTALGMIRSRA